METLWPNDNSIVVGGPPSPTSVRTVHCVSGWGAGMVGVRQYSPGHYTSALTAAAKRAQSVSLRTSNRPAEEERHG